MVTTHRKPSAILRAIGERIGRPEAWTIGQYARTAVGTAIDADRDRAVCWCWLGALKAEVPLDDHQSYEKTRRIMLDAIGRSQPGDLTLWNDTHTHAEVIAANARAVELAEAAGE